jgi:hypothetical protein
LSGKHSRPELREVKERRQNGGLLFSEKKEIENIALIMS